MCPYNRLAWKVKNFPLPLPQTRDRVSRQIFDPRGRRGQRIVVRVQGVECIIVLFALAAWLVQAVPSLLVHARVYAAHYLTTCPIADSQDHIMTAFLSFLPALFIVLPTILLIIVPAFISNFIGGRMTM